MIQSQKITKTKKLKNINWFRFLNSKYGERTAARELFARRGSSMTKEAEEKKRKNKRDLKNKGK